MSSKYKIKQGDISALLGIAEILMQGRYHSLYEKLGLVKGRSSNFHCFNASAHAGRTDNNASLSIDNETGVFNCFGCNMTGNIQSYWSDHIKTPSADSYTDWITDFLGIANCSYLEVATR